MIENELSKFKSEDFLSSINFINNSDLVFSATLNSNDFNKFNFEDIFIISESNDLITFINLNIEIKENDIIYSQTDYVEILFKYLQNVSLSNVKLITHQSDVKITKKLFRIKPKCISQWYSVNVEFENKNLIPIPLGLAPYRNSKSAIVQDFEKFDYNINKNKLIYSNFNINTNYFHRKQAILAMNKLKLTKNQHPIKYDDYLIEISKSKFLLSPWGNGVDSHRFWEAIYLKTIPITKNHYLYRTFNDFPMLLVDSYKEIKNLDNLKIEYSVNIEKLKMEWWIGLIKDKNIKVDNNLKLKFKIDNTSSIYKFLNTKIKKNKLVKANLTLARKLDKKFNIFRRI